MGTRNVTVIKYNGEEKVRQYGQWDGYPTSALATIVKFLKTDGAIEHLKRNLVKCKLVPEEQFVWDKKFDAIGDAAFKDFTILLKLKYNDRIERMVKNSTFSEQDIFKYYLATRDTGYSIPELLITSAADNATEIVLEKCYTDKIDWQIEAVNVIDLDAGRVISYWHKRNAEWYFDSLPDIEEIEQFDNGEEYAV